MDVHVHVPVRHRRLELQLQGLRRRDLGVEDPMHGVEELDRHALLPVRDVHQVLQVELPCDVGRHQLLRVVPDDEVQVVHKEVPVVLLLVVHGQGRLHAEGPIYGQLADEELEHVVGVDRFLPHLDVGLRDSLLAHHDPLHVPGEVHLVEGVHEPVSPEHLAEGHEVRHDHVGLAVGEVVVLVRLGRVRKGPDLVHAHLDLLLRRVGGFDASHHERQQHGEESAPAVGQPIAAPGPAQHGPLRRGGAGTQNQAAC
mmetsp:Transcript_74927/g.196511  ORF Transcript_74927/g.196511 Transcript_74927/m.196511 type:complete len:255 (-) Transcript_74927:11-775(-)